MVKENKLSFSLAEFYAGYISERDAFCNSLSVCPISTFDDRKLSTYTNLSIAIGAMMNECISDLFVNKRRNQHILKKRINLENSDNPTLQRIGDEFELSRERIRQICNSMQKRTISSEAQVTCKVRQAILSSFQQMPIDEFYFFIIYGLVYNFNLHFTRYVLAIVFETETAINIVLQSQRIFIMNLTQMCKNQKSFEEQTVMVEQIKQLLFNVD